MRYRYTICDVFTESPFGGNQLAVLPQAEGLSGRQMQRIAREFNFSESSFVLPPESGHTRKVRIFTPVREVPFAGHPNIGTAFALARAGEFGDFGRSTRVSFEEKAGVVAITVEKDSKGKIFCELTAPQDLSMGEPLPREKAAAAASLEPDDIVTAVHPPQEASVGLAFVIVQVRDSAALARASANIAAMRELATSDGRASTFLYCSGSGDVDIRARMFAPLSGVPEDPATGSANCALAGLLTHYNGAVEGDFKWRIAQGVEMGRPSILEASTEKRDGKIAAIRIGGACAFFSEGWIEIN